VPWFKVDDGLGTSKSVLRIPRRYRLQAVGLWTLAGAWCAKELTDGFVPEYVLEDLAGTKALAAHLVAAGLWEIAEDGWRFVGWGKYQPTRADVIAEREKEAERKRTWRESRKAAAAKQTVQVKAGASDECPAGTTMSVPSMSHPASDIPDPARPGPTRPVPKGTREGSARKPSAARGHRLPEGWEPAEEVVRQMREECPHVDLRIEHAKFTDHWNSQPGSKALKLDWTGTWRNWIRRSAESGPPRNGAYVRDGPSRADQKVQTYLSYGLPNQGKELQQ
jgi:hypothetical protein